MDQFLTFYGTIGLGLVLLAVLGRLGARYFRTKELRAVARSIGWAYVETDPTLPSRWRGRPFGVGGSRRVSELMTGIYQGRQALAFRYSYRTSSGRDRSTSAFHVVALALPAALPDLELTPESLGARIAKTLGGDDIEFESEAFNQAWRVRAEGARFAHDVVHPRLMERLLRDDVRGLNLRIEGTDLLCWTPGGARWGALASRLEVLGAVVDAIPQYVWLDNGYDPGPTGPAVPTGLSGPAGGMRPV